MPQVVTSPVDIAHEKMNAVSLAPADGPLFVIGMFRSGTSLLYALLNQHPRIAIMYESDLAHLPSLFWLRRDTRYWLAKWSFWNGALDRHKLDTSRIPSGIYNLEDAVRAVCVEYARQKKGATMWGCKSPTYYDEVSRLSRAFPNARFVIIWRDLTSVCRSIVAASGDNIFFSRKGMLLRALLGYREMKEQCDALVRRGGMVHQLYYEDLVRDPVATMTAVAAFLQIPFDPRMARLEGADKSAIQDGSHHSLVKSEKIISSRKSLEVLSPALKSKIERYIRMWRDMHDDTWPLYPQSLDPTTAYPSLWERVRDRTAYRMLSVWHHTIPIVFSFMPVLVWQKYRKVIEAWRYSRLPHKAAVPSD